MKMTIMVIIIMIIGRYVKGYNDYQYSCFLTSINGHQLKENYYQTITLESDPKLSSKKDKFAETSWTTAPSNGEKYSFVKQRAEWLKQQQKCIKYAP